MLKENKHQSEVYFANWQLNRSSLGLGFLQWSSMYLTLLLCWKVLGGFIVAVTLGTIASHTVLLGADQLMCFL